MSRKRKSNKPIEGRTPVSNLPASPRVDYAPDCPRCNSDETNVARTMSDTAWKTQYCKCRSCGWTWSHVLAVKPSGDVVERIT